MQNKDGTDQVMRIAIARLMAIGVLCCVTIATPAQAFHGNDLPVVFTTNAGRIGWLAFTIDADGPFPDDEPLADIEVEGSTQDAHSMADGLWVYDPSERGDWAVVGMYSSRGDAVVKLPDPVGYVIDTRQSTGGSHSGSAYTFVADGGPIHATVIVGHAIEDASASMEMRIAAHPDVDVQVLGSGSQGFIFRERDFAPQAYGSAVVASALLSGEVSVVTSGRLFGMFGTGTDVNGLRYSGPAGTSEGQRFLDGEPAGTHTFSVDHAVGAVFDATWAWGLDVDASVLPN